MKLKVSLLVLVFISIDCFSQHGGPQLKLKPIPANTQQQVVGYWKGDIIYQSESKEFILDIKKVNDRIEVFWSIYQTGNVLQKIERAGYDTATNQVVLDEFLYLTISPSNKNEIQCKLSRHEFLSKFKLTRSEKETSKCDTEDTNFYNKEVRLACTVFKPKSKGGQHPAVIFLHGSGPATRWDWAPYFAEQFAEMGFVSIIFDKRGCGESTGSWITSSLDDLSQDAVAALAYLKTRSDVNKNKIGIWGFSQSGWVAANATNFTNDIAFIISISGGGLTPKEIELYGYRNSLNHGNFNDSEKKEAMTLVDQYLNYLSNGQNRDALVEKISDARKNKSWYPYLGLGRVLPSPENRDKWSWVADWNPAPSIEKIKIPVLVIFGETDLQTEPKESAKRWRLGLEKAGNNNFKIITFKEASHGIRLGEHSQSQPMFWQEFAPGFVDTIKNWTKKI